jgi:hypothetical protein
MENRLGQEAKKMRRPKSRTALDGAATFESAYGLTVRKATPDELEQDQNGFLASGGGLFPWSLSDSYGYNTHHRRGRYLDALREGSTE